MGIDGGSNVVADPLFVNVTGADGIYGTEDDDLRLRQDSPMIDAGNNSLTSTNITADLAGNARHFDHPYRTDTGVGTAPIVDLGAYEFINGAPVLGGGTYPLL